MKFFTVALVYTILITAPCIAEESDSVYKNLDAASAKTLIAKFSKEKKKLIILDVRTASEYQEGHLSGSKQIDFFDPEFETKMNKLDKKQPYLIHCRSGARSRGALRKMQRLGFKIVYHLDGGILDWKKIGGAVTK